MSDAVASIIVGGLTLLGAMIGTYLSNRKSAALTAYRLEQLEKTVNANTCDQNARTDDLCRRVGNIESDLKVAKEQRNSMDRRIIDLEHAKH